MTIAPASDGALAKKETSTISNSTWSDFESVAKKARQCYGDAVKENLVAALEMAMLIQELRLFLDKQQIKDAILGLMNTPLGFRTDRDPSIKRKNRQTGQYESPRPYDYSTVKETVIEAMLRGIQLVGNQFNIISDRCYITKEGFAYLIKGLNDVKDFKPLIGVPTQKSGKMIIDCEATWVQGGQSRSLMASIPVKGDAYSTDDQLLGKAERKFFKRCFEMMTGNVSTDGDDDSLLLALDVAPQAVDPAVVTASASVPTMTKAQCNQILSSAQNVLTPLGSTAFERDLLTAFGVDSIAAIRADAFSQIMSNLAVSAYQEKWNQGLNAAGEQMFSDEELVSYADEDGNASEEAPLPQLQTSQAVEPEPVRAEPTRQPALVRRANQQELMG